MRNSISQQCIEALPALGKYRIPGYRLCDVGDGWSTLQGNPEKAQEAMQAAEQLVSE